MAAVHVYGGVGGDGPSAQHAQTMDRVYRLQRHIYDATRKFFLFGRDTLLHRMALRDGDRVLELGCGTARNLLMLAGRPSRPRLFGLDASREMLQTARASVAKRGLQDRIVLREGLAEQVRTQRPFGDVLLFDHVVFSYTLSMIPPWREAVEEGWRLLAPGGTLHVVDFWDQAGFPAWFQRLLRWWLGLFHVAPNPELVAHLQALAAREGARCTLRPLIGRYALCATITRADGRERAGALGRA
ncbi:MAG: class I SAM-dependent methyltransferase [Phycisphaerales bacterium]